MPKQDWSRKLARPVHVREYGTLSTLDDARHLVLEVLPAHFRQQQIWQAVAGDLITAAENGDILGASLSLEIALMLGGVRGRAPSE